MNNETLVISRARLVSLLGSYSFPAPDDDTPIWRIPHGPGPVASWLEALSRVALNPQPIPPGRLFVSIVAGAVIERAESVSDLSSLLGEQERGLTTRLGSELMEFVDDCGTMTRWQMIQNLLAWLRHHTPPPPQPDPWWQEKLSETEIIFVGGRIASAAQTFANQTIRSTLQNAGNRLVEQHLQPGRNEASFSAVPAGERV